MMPSLVVSAFCVYDNSFLCNLVFVFQKFKFKFEQTYLLRLINFSCFKCLFEEFLVRCVDMIIVNINWTLFIHFIQDTIIIVIFDAFEQFQLEIFIL